jgi:hypothetical protein
MSTRSSRGSLQLSARPCHLPTTLQHPTSSTRAPLANRKLLGSCRGIPSTPRAQPLFLRQAEQVSPPPLFPISCIFILADGQEFWSCATVYVLPLLLLYEYTGHRHGVITSIGAIAHGEYSKTGNALLQGCRWGVSLVDYRSCGGTYLY